MSANELVGSTKVVRHQGGWTNYIHLGASLCADLSPDGTKIASSATFGQLLIRDLSGKVLRRLNGHWNSVGWIKWSPQGDQIVSSCVDRTVRLWDVNTAECLAVYQHPDACLAADFIENGSAVASVSSDGDVRIWRGRTSESSRIPLDRSLGAQHGIAVSPDGTRLLISASMGLAIVNTNGTVEATWSGPIRSPRRSKWTSDGDRIIVPTDDGLVVLNDRLAQVGGGLVAGIRAESVDWSPDGGKVLLGLSSGEVKVVEFDSGATIATVAAHSSFPWDVTWSHASDNIVTVGVDGAVGVWKAADLSSVVKMGSFSRGVSCAEWSPDAGKIVTSSADGRFVVWDVEKRGAVVEKKAHAIWIRSIRWKPGSNEFLTASQDGHVKVWELSAGAGTGMMVELKSDVDPGIGPLWDGVWLSTGNIAVASEDGKIAIVDPGRPNTYRVFLVQDGSWVRALASDPKGEMLVVCCMDGRVEARSLNDANNLGVLWTKRLGTSCFDVAFSQDGDSFAVAQSNRIVAEFDRNGHQQGEFRGHDSEVWSVAFGADGNSLVSGGADGTVRTWARRTRLEQRSFRLTTACVSTSFSPSGLVLFGSAGAWIVDPESCGDEAGEKATTLTDSPVALLDAPAARDLLGRAALVDELGFFLHRTAELSIDQTPDGVPDGFLLQVGGSWGSGKTTLTSHLVKRICEMDPSVTPNSREDKVRRWNPIHFSAWQHEGLGPAWWSLIMVLRGAVLRERGVLGRLVFRVKELNWRFRGLFIGLLLILFGVAAALYILRKVGTETLVLWFSSTKEGERIGGVETVAGVVVSLASIAAGAGAIWKLVKRTRRAWRWPKSGSATVDLQMQSDKAELPRRYATWLRKYFQRDMLLIVDDVDRCAASYAVGLIGSLFGMCRQVEGSDATAGDCGAFGVLVLCDTTWLEDAFTSTTTPDDCESTSRTPGKSLGASYLEKVFACNVQIPRLSAGARVKVIRSATVEDPLSEQVVVVHPPAQVSGDAASRASEVVRASSQIARGAEESQSDALRQGVTENKEAMHRTIEDRLSDLARLAETEAALIEDYAHLMDGTARGVKRTLVTFWINRAIAHLPADHEPLDDESVMRWSIAYSRWPTLLQELARTPEGEWWNRASRSLGKEVADLKEVVGERDIDRMSRTFLA